MKTSIKPNTLIAVCFSVLTAAVQAQSSAVPGSESSLTFKMTASITVEGTTAKDENGKSLRPSVAVFSNEWTKQDKNGNVVEEDTEEVSKLLKVKISNREILEMLRSEGVIPDINGWALMLVSPAFPPDEEGDTGPYFYIVKSGAAPIYVGDYFEVWDYSSAEAYKRMSVTKYKYDSSGNMTSSTYKDSGSLTSSTAVYATFSTENGQLRDEALLQVNGIWQESASLAQFGGRDSTDYRLVPKSAKLTSISGDLSTYDKQTDTRTTSVIEGSWDARAKVVEDISAAYPEAAAAVDP